MQITVPALGESITEATIAGLNKKEGDFVKEDEVILELETDKITLEVNAPASGKLTKITVSEGDTVEVGALLAELDESGGSEESSSEKKEEKTENKEDSSSSGESEKEKDKDENKSKESSSENLLSPAAKKIAKEKGIDPSEVEGSGKDGRILKEDVMDKSYSRKENNEAKEGKSKSSNLGLFGKTTERTEERIKMSKLRMTIAKRLKESQNNAAILTTFNEIDMSEIINIRREYKDDFEKRHGVRLGFMSFFVKAAVYALEEFPAVNASIEGDEIIYRNYKDIGVAVGTPQGLVVPILRNADNLSFAGVEKTIGDLSKKANEGKLSMDELSGGTFTISNGGVYGSLMSTPIINPPQSGILGMHKIEKRPVVIDNEIVIRPMMYVALSYDHRIIDGKDSVSFLVKIKELIEDPRRLLLDL